MGILVNSMELGSRPSFNPLAPNLRGKRRTQRGEDPLHAPVGISYLGFRACRFGDTPNPGSILLHHGFEYCLGDRSVLDWIVDQYRVSGDKWRGILKTPTVMTQSTWFASLAK